MSTIRIDTYKSDVAGPRQWVAILQVVEPIQRDGTKLVGVSACMNFWGPSEPSCRQRAHAWLGAEQDRARKAEIASQRRQERLREYRQAASLESQSDLVLP
jgi:hypothetical protein